jgi:hypothetical protein
MPLFHGYNDNYYFIKGTMRTKTFTYGYHENNHFVSYGYHEHDLTSEIHFT